MDSYISITVAVFLFINFYFTYWALLLRVLHLHYWGANPMLWNSQQFAGRRGRLDEGVGVGANPPTRWLQWRWCVWNNKNARWHVFASSPVVVSFRLRCSLSDVGVVFQNVGVTVSSVPWCGWHAPLRCNPTSREDKCSECRDDLARIYASRFSNNYYVRFMWWY